MKKEDFEFILFDKLEKIKQINNEYDLENTSYVSFSGGKDSTVLHYLLDLALPNNNIPRLFMNTGIEYIKIVQFVKRLALEDSRIIINNSNVKIKKMLEVKGYPFKSKSHSHNLAIYQHSGMTKTNISYLGLDNQNTLFKCPNTLKQQFKPYYSLKVSDKCCYELKKKPMLKWAKKHNKTYALTGMRKSEGGARVKLDCIGNKKIHFLATLEDDFIEWFIKKYNIKLCELYYPPYNFVRCGCKGCPFALHLQEELDTLKKLLPSEYKQTWYLWGKVYKEYERLGYRLEKHIPNLFDHELKE